MKYPAHGLPGKKSCAGCMACVDVCKEKALLVEKADDGHLYPRFNNNNCNKCGSCMKTCPVVSGFHYKSVQDVSQPYAVWANNDELRFKSASGGAFAAFAEYIIEKGGCVVGATMDGLEVKHVMINDAKDISKLQGSKYMQGDMSGLYHEVKKKLLDGKLVFFTGLPCQAAGLIGYLKEKQYENLFTADLICSGVPTSFLVHSFNKHRNRQIASLSFTTKDKGWINSKNPTYQAVNGDDLSLKPNEGNLVMNGFLSGLTHRYSCYECKFAFQNRKADLTLADFWGVKLYPEQHFKGVSLVISHSAKGEKLLADSDVSKHLTTWCECVPFNPRLICGKRPLYSIHPARVFMSWCFSNLSYNNLTKIYAGKISVKDLAWLPYKVINYIVYKSSQFLIKKHTRVPE